MQPCITLAVLYRFRLESTFEQHQYQQWKAHLENQRQRGIRGMGREEVSDIYSGLLQAFYRTASRDQGSCWRRPISSLHPLLSSSPVEWTLGFALAILRNLRRCAELQMRSNTHVTCKMQSASSAKSCRKISPPVERHIEEVLSHKQLSRLVIAMCNKCWNTP